MDQAKHNISYCWKCGKLISQGQFCDVECRREYYAGIRKENDAIFSDDSIDYESFIIGDWRK